MPGKCSPVSLLRGGSFLFLVVCQYPFPCISTDRRALYVCAFLTMLKVNVKQKHAKKLSEDAIVLSRFGVKKSADELLTIILEDFFRGWRSDKRWMFYQQFK